MGESDEEFIRHCRDIHQTATAERWSCDKNTRIIAELADERASLQFRITNLEAAQRWIPVSERLPEYGVNVLVASMGLVQNTTYFLDGADDCPDWFEAVADSDITFWWNRATHWMPLPPAPQEEG